MRRLNGTGIDMKIIYYPLKKKYINRASIPRKITGFYDIDVFRNTRWEYTVTVSNFRELIDTILTITKEEVKVRVIVAQDYFLLWTNVK
jgi:hypothetical protein